MNELLDLIKSNEGFSASMYKCPADKLTIGYGFNLESSEIPRHVADLWLFTEVKKIRAALAGYPSDGYLWSVQI